ncbi:MAG: hypothetical protein LUD43_00385 [Firmicutes bacterium]|nr:hypothetical protein [Bacillota bacterium]
MRDDLGLVWGVAPNPIKETFYKKFLWMFQKTLTAHHASHGGLIFLFSANICMYVRGNEDCLSPAWQDIGSISAMSANAMFLEFLRGYFYKNTPLKLFTFVVLRLRVPQLSIFGVQ